MRFKLKRGLRSGKQSEERLQSFKLYFFGTKSNWGGGIMQYVFLISFSPLQRIFMEQLKCRKC